MKLKICLGLFTLVGACLLSHAYSPQLPLFLDAKLSTFSKTKYRNKTLLPLYSAKEFLEPSGDSVTFGKKSYWEESYRGHQDQEDKSFAWYSGWEEIEPFWSELTSKDDKILVPGVGNDPCVVDMHDGGWKYITAFDYSKEGVDLARQILGEERLFPKGNVQVQVADARALSCFDDGQFDAVFEKGTLDAIYLSGGTDLSLRREYLQLAVEEIARVLKPGGVVMSLNAPATKEIYRTFESGNREAETNSGEKVWQLLRDSRELYMTEDGFTSNNVDATIFVWKKTRSN